MNLEREKAEKREAQPSIPSPARPSRGKRLLAFIVRNWPWKLLSLVIAVCLWAGLINQDPTLTRERVFTDVNVAVIGADALQRNGLIVLTDFEAEPITVRLSAEVPQRAYNTVAASSYNPRIDLTRITEKGEQRLRVLTTSTTSYGTVESVTPDSIDVLVDTYVTNYRVPVTVRRTGDFPDGFYGTAASPDVSLVAVSGPQSVVSHLARVVVDFDASQLPATAGLERTALPMRFVNANDDELDSRFLSVTSAGVLMRTITVEQTLYHTRTLPMNTLALTTGAVANGYEIKSVRVVPATLTAAGDEIALKALDSLFVEQALDVTGMGASFTATLSVRQPSELVYLSADTVEVTVEIGPSIVSRRFDKVKLSFTDDTGLRKVACDQKNVAVTLTGPAPLLSSLKAASLQAYADVSALGEGEHTLPVLLKINDGIEPGVTYAAEPAAVTLSVTLR